jgi:hypothetical protein
MTRFDRNRGRMSRQMLEMEEFTAKELMRALSKKYRGDIAIDPLQTIPEQLEEFRSVGWLRFEYPKYFVQVD